MFSLDELRVRAVSQSMIRAGTLKDAIVRLGFVQADPIVAPARAEELILRHRVDEYRVGDLERAYPTLGIEEGGLYAYGFLSRPVWRLCHVPSRAALTGREKKILAHVTEVGETHPRELEATFGGQRAVNAWGGYSKVNKLALESLHHRGLLRVSRRIRGVRLYEAAPPPGDTVSPGERLRRLVLIVADILGPISASHLRTIASRLRRWLPGLRRAGRVVDRLVREGALEQQVVDGVPYLSSPSRDRVAEPSPTVRLLAPFDPVVWDRRRFEHLWGWAYRFEAYTPIAKRVRGYYAMPLLWRDRVIGWANASLTGHGLDVDLGFAERRPREAAFEAELEREIARLEAFLARPTER